MIYAGVGKTDPVGYYDEEAWRKEKCTYTKLDEFDEYGVMGGADATCFFGMAEHMYGYCEKVDNATKHFKDKVSSKHHPLAPTFRRDFIKGVMTMLDALTIIDVPVVFQLSHSSTGNMRSYQCCFVRVVATGLVPKPYLQFYDHLYKHPRYKYEKPLSPCGYLQACLDYERDASGFAKAPDDTDMGGHEFKATLEGKTMYEYLNID